MSHKPSIVFFLHSLSGGGTQVVFLNLAREFAVAGHRVIMVTQVEADGATAIHDERIETFVLNKAHTRHSPVALARFCIKWKADVLISGLPHNNMAAITAKVLCWGRLKVIVSEHAPIRELIRAMGWDRRLILSAMRLLYPLADGVVCVSRGIAEEMRILVPSARRVRVIYNPVFATNLQKLSQQPAHLPWTGDDPVIVTAARLATEKNLPFLLRSFLKLRERRKLKLVIVGDGPERQALEEIANTSPFKDDILFTGWVANPFSFLAKAKVVALTSNFEGFGNILAEALACGTPVVSTDCPFGPREILDNGRYGTLVDIGDETAFVEGLEQSIDAPPSADMLRMRATQFSGKTAMASYMSLIDEILGVKQMSRAMRPCFGMLQVAVYIHDLSGGGVERMTLQMIRRFKELGHAVTLVLHSASGPLSTEIGKDVSVVAFETSRTLSDVRPLSQFLRARRPDILLSSLDHNNLVALLASAISGVSTPVIPCQHNALSFEASNGDWKYKIMPLCYRALSPLASRFVAVSMGVAQDMSKVCGIRSEKISIIYNGVLDQEFDRRVNDRATHPWFEAASLPVFVSAGRLVAQKDHATLLRAFALARTRLPSRLLILGSGPLERELKCLAVHLGLADSVDFLGFVENPLPFFRQSSAFVLSSIFEGFGNVLVEAMGCGTPVITFDCPFGPAEIVGKSEFGLLVRERSAEALANAMASEAWRAWTADQLRARAASYKVNAMVDNYLMLMKEILAQRGGAEGVAT